ncbi:biotin-dependent carboxyltransferase family protein [Vibrio tarriae]|uniref:5-oxoprolinase subunit C family protein n=1 Tax=Vibrio tarriae TaxID=2014742 RepID=UPI000DE21742|nr:biotin-dependent carboxyltransferase family protein [Vibrio tarriae]RBM32618.1 allophanate hydrolase [Vibrio tarriae]
MLGKLYVLKAGPLTLLHDLGRYGFSHFGITPSGPVDEYAYSWANYLLANPVNCATLEITLGPAEFLLRSDAQLAIAGGDLNATLDGHPIANWSRFYAKQGQTLRFGLTRNGLRAYLAVQGGFTVSSQLGSVSTHVRQGLGGLTSQGLALQTGNDLAFSARQIAQKPVQMTFRFRPDYNLPLRLRVIESYQYQAFSPSAMESFYRSEFIVTPNSDRMGYRLQGETISPPDQAILSEGIALGAIQVPPNGQPIILLNDRQTIGGYPKLGCVARIDLPRLAQAKPGHSVQFVAGDLAGLQAVWCQWARFFGY